MKTITEEYFNTQLDTLYVDKSNMQNALAIQYMFDDTRDIIISPMSELEKEIAIKYQKKLHINKSGIDMYMYLIHVDRSDLPYKSDTQI